MNSGRSWLSSEFKVPASIEMVCDLESAEFGEGVGSWNVIVLWRSRVDTHTIKLGLMVVGVLSGCVGKIILFVCTMVCTVFECLFRSGVHKSRVSSL